MLKWILKLAFRSCYWLQQPLSGLLLSHASDRSWEWDVNTNLHASVKHEYRLCLCHKRRALRLMDAIRPLLQPLSLMRYSVTTTLATLLLMVRYRYTSVKDPQPLAKCCLLTAPLEAWWLDCPSKRQRVPLSLLVCIMIFRESSTTCSASLA